MPEIPLHQRVDAMLQESRMIMPELQTLFGFQLIAVFSQTFRELPPALRATHIIALIAVAVSIVLLMTPATYHRIRMPMSEEEGFIPFGSRFIVASLIPLAFALSADVFVILQWQVRRWWLSLLCAGMIAALCVVLWFGLALRDIASGSKRRR